MQKVLRYALPLGLTAFFAVTWGLLLRAHLAGRTHAPPKPEYGGLLRQDEQERRTAWGVYFGPKRIGEAETTIKRESDGTFSVRTETRVELAPAARYLMGIVGTLDVDFRASVSPLRGPLSFQVESKMLKTSLHGTVDGDQVILIGEVAGDRVNTAIPFSRQRFLGQVLAPLSGLSELREDQVGVTWTIEMVNPIAGSLQEATVTLEDAKTVQLEGEEVRLFRLAFASGSARWTSWVTGDGEVLLQGTPFGLTLRRDGLPGSVLMELADESVASPVP